MESSLLKVRALIETTVALHRSRSDQEKMITIISQDHDAMLAQARELISGARHSIDVMHARACGPGERIERSGRELICHAREGVKVRLLFNPEMVEEDYVREQLDGQRPVAIRVTRVPPLQALIADRETALVVAVCAVGLRASLIRAPELTHTLCTLFENVWTQAVPAGERLVFGDRHRVALARRILGTLHASVTDEVAAREQGISVRTYRRHVADIMALLGANSRFQAGVRAAELGLLPASSRSGSAQGPS
ncbi:TrmB family transcriptional regulator sugar-binding domain-containing protein [Streptomyces sp. NPDC058045]|uniref:TrmB family transcriptional regulator sugar-binding domain-containing protein n=1 Tax=Streptomyces sp. NPDC058045 TaxID=3346311 RepID=UPI0036F0AE54